MLVRTRLTRQIERTLPPTATPFRDRLFLGDSAEILKDLPRQSVDLVVTSPPYADNRKGAYRGFGIETYVEKFLPIAEELKRVMSPTGSFVLNIKERATNGERQTYVIELILALKKQGWLWTEEYIWCKTNCYPGKWPNRFRDSWERILHFTTRRDFKMRQERVMVPVGDWAKTRLKNLSETDQIRDESKVGSGFGKNVSNWLNRQMVYPSNVLHMATECSNKDHSAAYPLSLPTWFIKLLSDEQDLVLDPFLGSGTSAVAAIQLGRHFVGVELSEHYYRIAQEAVAEAQEEQRALRLRSANGHRRARAGHILESGRVPPETLRGREGSPAQPSLEAQEPVPV